MMKTEDGGLALSPEERLRMTKATRYMAGLAKFLLWCNSMPAHAVSFYASFQQAGSASTQIVQLDAALSSRFVVADSDIEGDDTVFFGAQAHEQVWLSIIPWSEIIFDGECLFFLYEPDAVMGMQTMQTLCVALRIPHVDARRLLRKNETLRFFEIYKIVNGRVTDYGGVLRETHPITHAKDIVKHLLERAAARQQKTKATMALL